MLGLGKAEWRGAGHRPCLHGQGSPPPQDEAERKGLAAGILARAWPEERASGRPAARAPDSQRSHMRSLGVMALGHAV